MEVRRILVPVDFSDCSYGVVEEAVGLAGRLGARVVLLHVVQLPTGVQPDTVLEPSPGATETAEGRLVADARHRMGHYPAPSPVDGVVVRHVVEVGQAVDRILAVADDLRVDLIVMGTHGRQGFARLVLGSVAERVLRRSRVPVMTIRAIHKPTCEAGSCATCTSGITPAELRTREEADG
jgi:nucleotide-binding universal stress UspA family protein